MKTVFSLLVSSLLFSSHFSFSQDTIIMRDSSIVLAKVYEVLPQEVKYKRFEMPDGPVYSESKKNIRLVIYSNGLKEEFKMEDILMNDSANLVRMPKPNYKIEDRNHHLIYMDKPLKEKDLNKLLIATNDKALIMLTTKSAKARQWRPLVFLAIPFAILTMGSALSYSWNSEEDTAFLTAGLALITIPMGITGIIKNGMHRAYRVKAIKLYNMKF